MNVFANITWAQKIPVALPIPLQIEHEVLPESLALWSCRQLQKKCHGKTSFIVRPSASNVRTMAGALSSSECADSRW